MGVEAEVRVGLRAYAFTLVIRARNGVGERELIRAVYPDIQPPGGAAEERCKGNWNDRGFAGILSVQRVQVCRERMGFTAEMGYPPAPIQFHAATAPCSRTPMAESAAEVDLGGRTLATLGVFGEPLRFLARLHPEPPDQVLRLSPELAGLFDRSVVDG